MILEAAIVNITRNLDIISQKDGHDISSHEKLKKDALNCLISLIEKAPNSEYEKLLNSENYSILLGYLVNVLCQLAKNDKSKSVRLQSLNIILTLACRLESLHDSPVARERCSINVVVTALPGVSSTLFRVIMSDTKLPKNLLVVAIKALAKFISVAFLPCKHKLKGPNQFHLQGKALTETCDNLTARLTFLFDYITSHSADLAKEVKHEILYLCEDIVHKTKSELLSRLLRSIVRYIAFVTSANECSRDAEVELRTMIMIDSIKEKIQNCDNPSDRLDSVALTCLFKLFDSLENDYLTMLASERESELSMLCGLLKILPRDSLTMFLEMSDKRVQLIKILTQLTEFSTNQPFLCLTETNIGDKAVEACNERIYTVEKRFSHLSPNEINIISNCCQTIGQNSDWLCLSDMFNIQFRKFSSPSNLFIAHLVLKGCSKRLDSNESKLGRFTKQMIEFYIEKTHELYSSFNETLKQGDEVCSRDILKVVIAIETVITLVESHIKFNESVSQRIIILKTLMCPLLNWSSSNSRAISEASLSALTQISHLYEHKSIKSLIEANIDYIVDRVAQMMDNFELNNDVTNVLAITFKLSSIDSFYFFRDVYEKVFRILGTYHHSDKAKSIALLFYRTVTILNDWKVAKNEDQSNDNRDQVPLNNEHSIKSVIYELDIKRRLKNLHEKMEETERVRRRIDAMKVTEADQDQVVKDIQSGSVPMEEDKQVVDEKEEEKKKEKPVDVALTEKILTHCIHLISSNNSETKILALKTATYGLRVMCDDEDTLLPLVHQLWSPLVSRLTGNYSENLEINLCAFECLVSMAVCAKDFIRMRTLDAIIPRLCLFLESQSNQSKGKKDYGPYCMTIAYKCQLRILTHLGALAYHIQLAYTSLWRVVRTTLIYLDSSQVVSLRQAARTSLHYMAALDADCVWYFTKKAGLLGELPFDAIYEMKVQ